VTSNPVHVRTAALTATLDTRIEDGTVAPSADPNATRSLPPQPALTAAPPPLAANRYHLLGEIAHGGMGVVYRAVDVALNREVAVKVLRQRLGPDSAAARRFLEEAQVAAQLQHPAVPPVHDVGTLPDGRPFLAMKLIKGRTLDQMLRERPDLDHDRGRFLAIFERVCQALAYAHSRRVIHRDLKPANVMVGAFGEVQVMDWGLAKVLPPFGQARAARPAGNEAGDTTVRTLRDAGGSDTQAGSVLGTPAFMPPEQACGDVDRTDARADVFGLGAILAVILTGQPPHVGASAEAVRRLAARGRLGDCFARLERCGAEPELVALCRRCLAVDPGQRPPSAAAVAQAVTELRAAAEERARQAELERAAAAARALEQRRRRRWQAGATLAGALLLALAGTAAWWADRQAAERRHEHVRAVKRLRRDVEEDIARAARLRDAFQLAEARDALDQADRRLPEDPPADIRERLDRAGAELTLICTLDEIAHDRVRSHPGEGARATPAAYRAAFQGFGLDPVTADPAAAAAWVAASPVKRHLVSALDTWALNEPDRGARDRLLAVLRRADPGPWADRLRDPAVWRDQAALDRLIAEADLADLPSHLLVLLFQIRQGPWPQSARAAINREADRRRDDFWVQFEVGFYYSYKDPQPGKAVGRLRAALALRRDHPYALSLLAHALEAVGDRAGAEYSFREAVRLDPRLPWHHNNLAVILRRKGDLSGAEMSFRDALRLDPGYALARANLADLLLERGDLEGAADCLRGTLRSHPEDAEARADLAQVERLRRLLSRLDDVAGGRVDPVDPVEALDFADLCALGYQKRYAASARLAAAAFAVRPDLAVARRCHAACAAALAGCGHGADAATLTADQRAALRGLAAGWLREELARRRPPGPGEADQAGVDDLRHWLRYRGLAAVRDPEALRALPAAEREQWDRLWDDVRALVGGAAQEG
jgi:tetratricopeptide (TPR) repeat protein